MNRLPIRQQLFASALFILPLTTLVACGPTLRPKAARVRAYSSTRACSQGPFIVDLPATGARWGEQIVVQVWTRHAIAGRYDVTVGKEVILRGRFGPGHHRYQTTNAERSTFNWQYTTPKGPDNARCIAAAGTRATASTPTAGNDTGGGGSNTAPKAPVPRSGVTPRATPGQVLLFKPLSTTEYTDHRAIRHSFLRHDLLNLDLGRVSTPRYPSCNPSRRNEIAKGARIRIRLWSETPNDMREAWIEVRQNTYHPSVPEAKYLGYLDEQKASCLKKAKRVARKWERKRRKRRPRPLGSRKCYVGHTFRGAKLKHTHRSKLKRCDCWTRSGLSRKSCWGKGGYLAHRARLRRKLTSLTCRVRVELKDGAKTLLSIMEKKSCHCAFDLSDRSCWGPGGYAAYARARWAKRQRDRLRRRLMKQPPPAPRVEKKPPSPSRNAIWVGGYWVRIKGGPAAGRWGWIAGWWRVPPADVKRGLTAKTRRRPPRKRLVVKRRPPKPAPAAVWAPGYWHWTGRRHVWVHGAWRIPPRSQLRWRPARWIRRGPFLILVPGGWIR